MYTQQCVLEKQTFIYSIYGDICLAIRFIIDASRRRVGRTHAAHQQHTYVKGNANNGNCFYIFCVLCARWHIILCGVFSFFMGYL